MKRFDPSTSKYDVEDIDEEQKERYVLTKKKIIPLPRMRAHPQLNPEAMFELNAVVWALYPQTTCFYKGVVERRPQGPNVARTQRRLLCGIRRHFLSFWFLASTGRPTTIRGGTLSQVVPRTIPSFSCIYLSVAR